MDEGKASKFANDMELCKDVVTEQDACTMKEGLRRMHEWTWDIIMFSYTSGNVPSVTRMGKGNVKFKYFMQE